MAKINELITQLDELAHQLREQQLSDKVRQQVVNKICDINRQLEQHINIVEVQLQS